ncbi:glycosyl transferase group 1 [Methanofollis liminatans DSM 4140]|uniref:Glycosyl transferase group 1 n=2 Tax=Methanofollis liminatans TaxID=2201 RepID=J1APE6_9EURY|nr:glycosyl transferase group 1 [Methanofollis liminatans DSM 4140]
MRIALLVMMFPPKNLGGTEIASYNIAKHLARRNHEVHVITSSDPGVPNYKSESGFFIHRTVLNHTKYIGIVLFAITSMIQVTKIRPDIIHAQNITMGMIAFFGKKFFKIPYVVWGRGSDVHLQWKFKKYVSKIVLNNADVSIALSQNMKDEMQKLSKKDIYVIPNGIDPAIFKESKVKKDYTGTKIIYVGSLLPIKGVKYLIKAMQILHPTNPDIHLTIVGDGSDRRSLEQMVHEYALVQNISFVGKLPHKDIPQWLCNNNILVLPSNSEGMPNVLLEAMAAGLPVVATNVGGIPDIIKNKRNGYLVEPKNPQEIAEKIQYLINNSQMRKIISEQNKMDSQRYNWNNIVQNLDSLYSKVLKTD